MSTYIIGDIHGCYTEMMLLLKKVSFNSQKDYLWVTGDMVARGPDSLKVLRYLYSLQDRVKIVLGNHDLNLISVFFGNKKNKKENCFNNLFNADDSITLMHWLRNQSVLQIDEDQKIIMVHAGISPHWSLNEVKFYAKKISLLLSSDNYLSFLDSVYDNNITEWSINLSMLDKLKYSINVFTRMRYCYPNGKLNLFYKDSPCYIKYPLQPWFLIDRNIPKEYSIFFGHWSSLKKTNMIEPFYPLDTGCCWGGKLTLIRLEDKKYFSELSKK
ncbi:symmetrical bis(5'-nucleosyl)-tetraphosphatase [Buchnera aphidicola]|uniref:symmetrical bis(5'-nucleosyl)-tetraphosphatase n=1 Tax=Buchnera aphidicola TaxID=9 RepID=UPI003BEEDFDD